MNHIMRGDSGYHRSTSLQAAVNRIDKMIREKLSIHEAPGLVCALTDRQRLLWQAAYGYADLAAKRPLSTGDLFEIGSIGKSFTALALLKREALRLLNAAAQGRPLPTIETGEAGQEANLKEFTGSYASGDGIVRVEAGSDRLQIERNGHRTEAVPRGDDQFYTRQPGLDHYLLAFERQEGQIVKLVNGPHCFLKSGAGYRNADGSVPEDWQAYLGHFRTCNPWFLNFRIYIREGRMNMAFSMYLISKETRLFPDGDGAFIVGEEPTPERITFDTIINCEAQRARVYGGGYYRFFSP